MNGEPKAIERTEKDRGITTSVPAYQRIENSNVILPQQSAGNLAIQRQSQREQLEEAPGRWTTCVVSHHQPSTAQREPPPPPGKWDELRRFVEANAPGRPFPPPRKPTGQPIEVAVTQDVSVPSPGGKPRTVYTLEFSRGVTREQAREVVFGNAPPNVTGLTPRARLIDRGAPSAAHHVYSLDLTDESAPFVQPAIAQRLREALGVKVAPVPPLEEQIPKWLPDEARRAILGGQIGRGIRRFVSKGPRGTAFVWHGHDEFGREVYQIFEEYPEDPKFYLKWTEGDTREARLLAKVNARFNRDMRYLLVNERDEPELKPPRSGLPPLPGLVSPFEARQKLIELYGEEFKLVIEAFVGVIGAGAGITAAGGGLRQQLLAAEKEQVLASAERLLARPDPVSKRLRGLQRAWWEYEGPKSRAEWLKTEAPQELRGVAGESSGFAKSRVEELLSETKSYSRKSAEELFFEPSNISGAERIDPAQIKAELEKTPLGRETLEILDDPDVMVWIDYEGGGQQKKFLLKGETMVSSQGRSVTIFAKGTGTAKTAAETAVHEGTHVAGIQGSRRAELIAEVRAYKHANGLVTLTPTRINLDAIKRIKAEVEASYQDLPPRKYPGGLF